MASSPITTFTLYKVPFDPTFRNVTDFASKTQRNNYFANLPHSTTYVEAQYIRKNSKYNVPLLFDNVEDYNYIVYNNNEGRGNEYAFIKEKRFLSFEATELTLVADVWQNNLFNMNLGQSMVERCHLPRYKANGDPNFDVMHIPEGGASANRITQSTIYHQGELLWLCLVIDLFGTTIQERPASMFDGYSVIFFPFKRSDHGATLTGGGLTFSTLPEIVEHLEHNEMVACYLCSWVPFNFALSGNNVTITGGNTQWNAHQFDLSGLFTGTLTGISCSTPPSQPYEMTARMPFDPTRVATLPSSANNRSMNYEPKLLCAPYDYHVLNVGASHLQIKKEYVQDPSKNTFDLNIVPFMAFGGVGITVDTADLKNETRLSSRIQDLSSPNISIRTDAFKSFMYNNGSQWVFNTALSVGSVVAGGVGAGMATSAIEGATTAKEFAGAVSDLNTQAMNGANAFKGLGGNLLSTFDTLAKADTPRSSSYMAVAEISKGTDGNAFVLNHYTLDPTAKQILFDRFTKYGYEINAVRNVTLRTRYYFDYIKTVGLHIDGVYCIEEETALEAMFNAGLTVWHCNGDATPTVLNYGDYSKENAERAFA